MLLGDLFQKDVTRTIPPVVYFHEQQPAELKREVDEYIITGGYDATDDRATEDGIHEQFVRLLTNIRKDLDAPQVHLPACWISGFFGSGKSSFAKLLGLALDGMVLSDQRLLSDALVAQDHSPNAPKLKAAWARLTENIKPISVVFDVGANARDEEHVHSVIVRQVQQRFGYSKTSQLVADYELKLELDGQDGAFREKVAEIHKKPWGELKDKQLVEDEFSRVMHALRPELYADPMTWVDSHSGSVTSGKRSADESALAIQQMMDRRFPGRTLFIVVDEVSQYVHENNERMLTLQSFVSALGQRLKGKAWLLATGQQKLEDGSGAGASIVKLKDRFPPALRVHLGTANIRDVVHKRLLRKKQLVEPDLRALFDAHRADLELYAHEATGLTETAFVEIYPLLPKHVDLLLDVTSGLRASTRSQGDAFAIRGLLQLLGDLFKQHGLASREVGTIVSIDLVYDVLASALGPDVQLTIGRALEHARKTGNKMIERAVKAVAMLALLDQEKHPTTAEFVSRCLYQRLGQGNEQPLVQAALDDLVGHGFVAFSEKTGYKIESAAGQEWQRDRDAYHPTAEQISTSVRERLAGLMAEADKAQIKTDTEKFDFPWLALYSDGLGARDVRIKDEKRPTVLTVDFQFTKGEGAETWVPRSDSLGFQERFIWVVGDSQDARTLATKHLQSKRIVDRYETGQSSFGEEKRRLLVEERNRMDGLWRDLERALEGAFMAGRIYFRGAEKRAADLGPTFHKALEAQGNAIVRAIYPHPMTFAVTEAEFKFLLENKDLSAPPKVFGQEKLGLLQQDGGRWQVTCNGHLPTEVLAFVKAHGSVEGATLIQHFGGPPHGVAPDLVRATVIGLLRGSKIRVTLPGIGELTSVVDEGSRELLKETGLRKAQISLNEKVVLTLRDRNEICNLFKAAFKVDVPRENEAIADAVHAHFASARERLNVIGERFRRLPKGIPYPPALDKLAGVLEQCRRTRQVEPTLTALRVTLPALGDGLTVLRRLESELVDGSVELLRQAEDALQFYVPGLEPASDDVQSAIARLREQLQSERPWEGASTLEADIALVRTAYRDKRRAVLEAHAKKLEARIEDVKRRDGYDRLEDADHRHQVLRHLHAATANTDDKAIAPSLEALPALLQTRLDQAYEKALTELGALIASKGGPPIVELSVDARGTEIRSEAELDRFLGDLRRRILHELSVNHHVRLK